MQIFVLLALAFVALGQDDGKYRPTEAAPVATVVPRVFPTTTRVPVYRYNDPRTAWNAGRWSNDRYDPRYDVNSRFDARHIPSGKDDMKKSHQFYSNLNFSWQTLHTTFLS